MARAPVVEEDLINRHRDTQPNSERDDRAGKSFAASPEEGRRLILAFLRIQSAELRESIINIVTNLSINPPLSALRFSSDAAPEKWPLRGSPATSRRPL
jgi:hypothetical protein